MYRKLYVEVDVDKIKNNVKNIINKYNDYEYYIGVVKGNAYGHGAYLSKYLLETGVNYFAVSSLDEAIEVRNYIDKPILCLEPIELEYIDLIIKNDITITVSSIEYYHELIKKDVKGLKVHLKLNTGLNRLGIKTKEEVEEIYNGLITNENIELEGIYTHFATTGVLDKLYDNQVAKFIEITSTIDLKKIKIVHLGRSASLELHPKLDIANGVRLGIMMYGIGQTFRKYNGLKGKLQKIKHNYLRKKDNISKTYDQTDLELNTAISLKTTVMELQHLQVGEFVGYGGTYKASKDTIIAICPIGYADGISLKYRHSKVAINGKKYNIVGVINMGMITIEVDETVHTGDEVTILGNEIDIRTISNVIESTPYVVMTSINPNIPRKYIKDKKVDKIVEEVFYEKK